MVVRRVASGSYELCPLLLPLPRLRLRLLLLASSQKVEAASVSGSHPTQVTRLLEERRFARAYLRRQARVLPIHSFCESSLALSALTLTSDSGRRPNPVVSAFWDLASAHPFHPCRLAPHGRADLEQQVLSCLGYPFLSRHQDCRAVSFRDPPSWRECKQLSHGKTVGRHRAPFPSESWYAPGEGRMASLQCWPHCTLWPVFPL